MLWRTALIVVLAIFDLTLFSRVLWGPTGIVEYKNLKTQLADLRNAINSLDEQNLSLSREIRLLQTDDQYLEKMVRQKIHFMRDNEIVYIFASPVNNRVGAKKDDGQD